MAHLGIGPIWTTLVSGSGLVKNLEIVRGKNYFRPIHVKGGETSVRKSIKPTKGKVIAHPAKHKMIKGAKAKKTK